MTEPLPDTTEPAATALGGAPTPLGPTAETRKTTSTEDPSFDSREWAAPHCQTCEGRGMKRVPIGVKMDGTPRMQWALCPCTLLERRRRYAESVINRVFGAGKSAGWTIAAYDTGGDALNEMAKTAAINFIENWQRAKDESWIVGFHGEPTGGKTHLATGIARALVKRYGIIPCVLSVPKMLRKERASFNAETTEGRKSAIQEAMDADLLVLDDLGAEYLRQNSAGVNDVSWVGEQIFLILDERISAGRPTLYTTNYDQSTLREKLNMLDKTGRLWGRIERSQVAAFAMRRVAGKTKPNVAARSALLAPLPQTTQQRKPSSADTSTQLSTPPPAAPHQNGGEA